MNKLKNDIDIIKKQIDERNYNLKLLDDLLKSFVLPIFLFIYFVFMFCIIIKFYEIEKIMKIFSEKDV